MPRRPRCLRRLPGRRWQRRIVAAYGGGTDGWHAGSGPKSRRVELAPPAGQLHAWTASRAGRLWRLHGGAIGSRGCWLGGARAVGHPAIEVGQGGAQQRRVLEAVEGRGHRGSRRRGRRRSGAGRRGVLMFRRRHRRGRLRAGRRRGCRQVGCGPRAPGRPSIRRRCRVYITFGRSPWEARRDSRPSVEASCRIVWGSSAKGNRLLWLRVAWLDGWRSARFELAALSHRRRR